MPPGRSFHGCIIGQMIRRIVGPVVLLDVFVWQFSRTANQPNDIKKSLIQRIAGKLISLFGSILKMSQTRTTHKCLSERHFSFKEKANKCLFCAFIYIILISPRSSSQSNLLSFENRLQQFFPLLLGFA